MNTKKIKEFWSRFFYDSTHFRWVLLACVTLLFTLALYPNLVVTKESYNIGDVAERDIKASRDFFVENSVATEKKRQKALEEVLTVYDLDARLSHKLSGRIKEALAGMREAYRSQMQDRERIAGPYALTEATNTETATIFEMDVLGQMKDVFEKISGLKISDDHYNALADAVFSDNIAALVQTILAETMENGVVANKEIFLRENDKGILLRNIQTKSETIIRNPKKFYDMDQARSRVKGIGQPLLKELSHPLQDLIVDLVQYLIQPNVTANRHETEERKNRAAAIQPVLYKVKAGEMVLREGERVTADGLVKLKAMRDQINKEQIKQSSIGTAIIILCLLVATYVLHLNRHRESGGHHNKNLLFITCVLVTFFFLAEISASLSDSLPQKASFLFSASSFFFAIPLASGAMLVCLFLGLEIAVAFSVVLAVCASIIFNNRLEIFIYFLLNGALAAYWVQPCRERKVLIMAGLKIGMLNVVLTTAVHTYMTNAASSNLLGDWILAFLGGIGAGIVTAGIAPLVEFAFGYTTDITLLELANLDRPILRRLMLEAPGTYHHSVIVGSLVEAAASEIGANPLLAKVCGYYHDIGKIKKPMYFIENQMNGKNKHDKLAPSMSSLILISHVKHGVEIAKENKVSQVIIDTIQQHHGSGLIQFFYDKARQSKGKESVNIDNFRYPGPRPQTKEAGLVMLADQVEAASRTLDNPTPARLQGLVQNLINKVFSDGQLDHCELTLKDLHNIAKSFNKILNGIHHHRVEYSEKLVPENGKKKDGNPDRQQANPAQNSDRESKEKSKGHLKRLGLS